MMNRQSQACAETATTEAPQMTRGQVFARVVLSGVTCVNQGKSAPWAQSAFKTLEPLAVEAIALPATLRDHRFQLYQQLMYNAEVRGDRGTVSRWGERWLNELDATKPANDDERSALDVARVDAASVLGDPLRVLPALIASEQAMPNNYNASLRLAQMANEAKQYNQAIAACKRGLAHVSGPIGRTWLLQTEAEALSGKGQSVEAKRALEAALRSARLIGVKASRERNIGVISKALKEMENAAK
jgi:tetratricopeptide (TPR) repeat protein